MIPPYFLWPKWLRTLTGPLHRFHLRQEKRRLEGTIKSSGSNVWYVVFYVAPWFLLANLFGGLMLADMYLLDGTWVQLPLLVLAVTCLAVSQILGYRAQRLINEQKPMPHDWDPRYKRIKEIESDLSREAP